MDDPDPPPDWSPCENRADPGSWDDPAIVDEPDEPDEITTEGT